MGSQNGAAAETPEMMSLMGYSLAKESGQLKEGISLCEKAISLNPNHVDHYLNLGRTYLLANKRERALKAFKAGLKVRKDQRIINELKSMGVRKAPVVGALSRDHMINIYAGKLLKLLKLR